MAGEGSLWSLIQRPEPPVGTGTSCKKYDMRLAWATDIHLNFLATPDRRQFLDSINGQADALVVTGDIAESNSLGEILRQVSLVLDMPVYFVVGNHDFYRGSVAGTRADVAEMIRGSEKLVYLTQAGVVELTPNAALVGHDGWADARLGDFDGSEVILNDFLLIEELRHWRDHYTLDKPALRAALQVLGDEAAGHMGRILPSAAKRYSQIVVATHVPPFREAAWHQGQPSGDDYLPFFSCKAVGDVLLEAARSYPCRQILALCGHTHSGGEVQVLENLRGLTGAAEYAQPRIERVFTIG